MIVSLTHGSEAVDDHDSSELKDTPKPHVQMNITLHISISTPKPPTTADASSSQRINSLLSKILHLEEKLKELDKSMEAKKADVRKLRKKNHVDKGWSNKLRDTYEEYLDISRESGATKADLDVAKMKLELEMDKVVARNSQRKQ